MRKNIIKILLVLIALVAVLGFYFYNKADSLQTDPNVLTQKQTNDIVSRVGKLILLPEGETPTVATVSDPAKLKDQAFFANAQVGDAVLFYPNIRRVYLYNPTQNKIINIAPIVFEPTESSVKTPVKSGSTKAKTTTTR